MYPFVKAKTKKAWEKTNARFEIDRTQLMEMAKDLTDLREDGAKKFILKAISTPQYIVPKQRVAGDPWMNQQGAKPAKGEVDEDFKTVLFELEERPAGMSDADAESRITAVIDNVVAGFKAIEADPVRPFGAALGKPQAFTDGSDHGPLVPHPVETLPLGAHALIGTAGATGMRPQIEVFVVSNDAEAAIRVTAGIKLMEALKAAVFEAHPNMKDAQKAEITALGYCEFAKYIQDTKDPKSHKELSDTLLTTEGKVILKKHIKAWVNTAEYQAANLNLQTSRLRTRLDPRDWNNTVIDGVAIDTLVDNMTKDIVNTIGEKGLDSQVGAGYLPLEGQNAREAQFYSLTEEVASVFVVTEAGEMTQKEVDSGSLKVRGHLKARSDMRAVAEVRDLMSYLRDTGDYKEEKEYVETFKLSDKLNALRSRVLDKEIKKLNGAFTEADLADGANVLTVNALVGTALDEKAGNEDIACALAANAEIQAKVVEDLKARVDDLTSIDITIIAGIPAIQAAMQAALIGEITKANARITLNAVEIIARVPAIAEALATFALTTKDETLMKSLLDQPSIQSYVVKDLIARAGTLTEEDCNIIAYAPICKKLAFAFSDIEEKKLRTALLKNEKLQESLIKELAEDLGERAKKFGALTLVDNEIIASSKVLVDYVADAVQENSNTYNFTKALAGLEAVQKVLIPRFEQKLKLETITLHEMTVIGAVPKLAEKVASVEMPVETAKAMAKTSPDFQKAAHAKCVASTTAVMSELKGATLTISKDSTVINVGASHITIPENKVTEAGVKKVLQEKRVEAAAAVASRYAGSTVTPVGDTVVVKVGSASVEMPKEALTTEEMNAALAAKRASRRGGAR
jgi:hypothetical protein